MRALLFTCDPYEPSGVVGLYETKEQKATILRQHREHWEKYELPKYQQEDYHYRWLPLTERLQKAEESYSGIVDELIEIEIPIGVYGCYYDPDDAVESQL
jgi:hypothetical protein